MSLLTPLYIAGLLAVSLPVVFHLIRRMPRGRFAFSTLMFLAPSPPRLTRKSRLDNVLLLLFRALALILLALAFTRPFWREAVSSEPLGDRSRRVAILLDTSASMRRGDLWQQALAKVDDLLDDLRPQDDAALFAFDSDVETLAGFDDPTATEPGQEAARIRAALRGLSPSWAASDLGHALIVAAEELNRSADLSPGDSHSAPGDSPGAKRGSAGVVRQIALVSDFQQGCRIDALRAYDWPGDVQLAVHGLAPASPTNAALHLISDRSAEFAEDAGRQIRIRVTNDPDSRAEQFQLNWAGSQGMVSPDDSISVHVPPGESRTVRVPRLPEEIEADQLVLSGDDCPFDNTYYLAQLRQEEITLLYVGSDEGDDVQAMRHYLQTAFSETPRRKIELIAREPEQSLSEEDLAATRLVVVTEAVPDVQAARLRQHIEDGGTVFYVLRDVAAGEALAIVMGQDDLAVAEAQTDDYAMLAEIQFEHPLFAPFAAVPFNDFTKVHFWQHRRVELDDLPGVQVLARFDDGAPALVERTLGKGRLLVLTSGWHPADSQLARWSKFVPLLDGVLERAGVSDPVLPQYQVEDQVILALGEVDSSDAVVRKPDGSEVKLPSGAGAFSEADQPGVYRLSVAGIQRDFAVNVPAAESRTAPLEAKQLGEFDVRLAGQPPSAEQAEQRRQMRDMELEGKQKFWRWLIMAALGVLIVETWLAGRLARRTRAQPEFRG